MSPSLDSVNSSPDPAVLLREPDLTAGHLAPPAFTLQPLALWHLLSLDAPVVATVWTWFIARSFRLTLDKVELVGMFLAVWILYVADRLLDSFAWTRPQAARAFDLRSRRFDLRQRHYFHARYRMAFGCSLAVALLILTASVARFPRAEIVLNLVAGTLLAAWFAVVHGVARRFALRLPKELAVGLFFAAAIFIPTLARQPDLWPAVLLPAILFGLLCTMNGLFIHVWEADPARKAHTNADCLTRLLIRNVSRLAWLCCLLPLALAAFGHGGHAEIYGALSLSAAALLALNRFRHAFEPTALRALADFVLLSPLLLAALFR